MAAKAVHVVISGRVQGVWFRGWAGQEAAARQISGWVRNRRNGTVEAVFQGDPADVDAMIEACWRGPMMAKVRDIQVSEAEHVDQKDFRQLPTI